MKKSKESSSLKKIKDYLPSISKQKMKLISDASDIILNPDKTELAFMAHQLVQATLPHKNPGDIPAWSRKNGDLTLTIRPAWDHKTNKSIGYPYGTIPRLLLFWITTEAVRTQNRRLELGKSLVEFMHNIGLNYYTGGGKRGDIKRLKDQMHRLLRATISLDIINDKPTRKRWLDMQIAPEGELWWNLKSTSQSTLFGSWIELSDKFYEAIISSPVPINMCILKALKRSPLALDLYTWVSYTAYQTQKTGHFRSISWKLLHKQFGSEYNDVKNFSKKVLEALLKIKIFYPGLSFERTRGGINILPSNPSIRIRSKKTKNTSTK